MRWVGLALAALSLAPAAIGQPRGLGGEWSVELSLLPTPNLGLVSLKLQTERNGWTVSSATETSGTWGWIWQEFEIKGDFGPLGVEGTLLFGPAVADFLFAQAVYSLALADIDLKAHTALIGPALGGPRGGTVFEAGFSRDRTRITGQLGLGAWLPADGFTIHHVSGSSRTYATDPHPGGSGFTHALLAAEGIPLSWGIACDLTVSLHKTGLDRLSISATNIPICCGLSVDVEATYGAGNGTLAIAPKLAGFAEVCVEVWGEAGLAGRAWAGIEIDGYRIRWGIRDCQHLELINAVHVSAVNKRLDPSDRLAADGGEFALLRLGTCGGQYTVDLRLFFGTRGGAFGITRFAFTGRISVLANLTLGLDATLCPAPGGCCDPSGGAVCIGWMFTF